jgi:hypothetical protein
VADQPPDIHEVEFPVGPVPTQKTAFEDAELRLTVKDDGLDGQIDSMERRKLQYDHAKVANAHADGMIQSAERKGTFVLTIVSAVFLFLANDLLPRVSNVLNFAEKPIPWFFSALFVMLCCIFVLISFNSLFLVFVPRTEEYQFMNDEWEVHQKPEELVFFGEVAKLDGGAYLDRYARLDYKMACSDLGYQVYKQAKIAGIKFGHFSDAWGPARYSVLLCGISILITRIFSIVAAR